MKRTKIKSKTVKTEDGATEVMVPPRNETMENFEATIHDRCSNQLSIATFKWVQRSHMLHKGTPVIITDERSPFKGRRGCVEEVNQGMMFNVRIWAHPDDEDDDKSVLVQIHQTRIKRAGITLASAVHEGSSKAMETVVASIEFMAEARKEIARLAAGNESSSGEEGNRDCEGARVYTGDIVVIDDRGRYHGWSGQVQHVCPGGILSLSLGMPPGYRRASEQAYERMRLTRPPGQTVEVAGASCKLMNVIA